MKRPTSWSFKAIFVGWAVGLFGVIIVGLPLFMLVVGILSARGVTEQQIDRLEHEPPFLLALLFIEVLSNTVSGFVTSHLARHDQLLHAGATGLVEIIFSITLLIFFPDLDSPLWYDVVSFALILPCSILGGYLRLKRPRRESPQSPTHPPIPEP